MNVKFINTLFQQTEEKLRKLNKIQELLRFSKIQYLNEIRNDPPWIQAGRLKELPKMYRARWKVYGPNDYVDPRDIVEIE